VRIAALDLGSNSFHLMVADATHDDGKTQIRVVDRAREMVRIGEATLLTGVIPSEGFLRGLDALATLRRTAERHRPDAFLAAATSAIREASNGVAFVRAGRHVTGSEIRVIDGHEEAKLIYFGARPVLRLAGRRVALFDLGGGSLELVVADEQQIRLSVSLKLGVLRLKEEHLGSGASGVVGTKALARLRDAALAAIEPAMSRARAVGFDFVVFTAGTARTLCAMVGSRKSGASASTKLTLASLARLEAELAALPSAARAALPGSDPRRADTLLPGAVILRTILELSGHTEATYCEPALREGMIAAFLAGDW
jgi:exopolyphosphatase/guanosine-5'-triphosphate,3'-diphosphate pyrophosphatase